MLHHRRDVSLVNDIPYINMQDKKHPVVTRDTRDFLQKLCSVGASSNREVIELTPHSPQLLTKYQKIKDKISKEMPTERILAAVISVTRNCFPSTSLDDLSQLSSRSVINLEVFISNGKGVCRHHALLNAYFLSCLVRDGYVYGEVIHHRQNLPGGEAHAWNAFMC